MKETSILIKGIWAENEEENAYYVITENKPEDFDTGYLYNYEINSRKYFMISDSNQIVSEFKIIKLTKDSLVIQGKNEGDRNIIYKYYKR